MLNDIFIQLAKYIHYMYSYLSQKNKPTTKALHGTVKRIQNFHYTSGIFCLCLSGVNYVFENKSLKIPANFLLHLSIQRQTSKTSSFRRKGPLSFYQSKFVSSVMTTEACAVEAASITQCLILGAVETAKLIYGGCIFFLSCFCSMERIQNYSLFK